MPSNLSFQRCRSRAGAVKLSKLPKSDIISLWIILGNKQGKKYPKKDDMVVFLEQMWTKAVEDFNFQASIEPNRMREDGTEFEEIGEENEEYEL